MSASIFIYISACYLASKHGICLFGRHYDNFTCIIMFYISSFWKESREWYKSALLAKTLRKFDEFLFPLSQSDNRKWHWNEKFNRHKQRNCFLIFCNHIFVVEHITLRDRTYFHLDWANSLPKSRRNEKCVTVWYTCSNGPNLCRRFWPLLLSRYNSLSLHTHFHFHRNHGEQYAFDCKSFSLSFETISSLYAYCHPLGVIAAIVIR